MWRGMCKSSSINYGYGFRGLHVRLTCRPSNMSVIWLVGDLFVTDLWQPLLMLYGLAVKPCGLGFNRNIPKSVLIPSHKRWTRYFEDRVSKLWGSVALVTFLIETWFPSGNMIELTRASTRSSRGPFPSFGPAKADVANETRPTRDAMSGCDVPLGRTLASGGRRWLQAGRPPYVKLSGHSAPSTVADRSLEETDMCSSLCRLHRISRNLAENELTIGGYLNYGPATISTLTLMGKGAGKAILDKGEHRSGGMTGNQCTSVNAHVASDEWPEVFLGVMSLQATTMNSCMSSGVVGTMLYTLSFSVPHRKKSRCLRLRSGEQAGHFSTPPRLIHRVGGATGAERLALSPPTKANRVQSPAGSPDFRKWESRRTMPLVGGFSRGSPVSFPPPLHSGAAPYSLQSPSSALKTSLLRAAQISSLHLHKTFEERLDNLRIVLFALRNAGLTVNPEKVTRANTYVGYLGFIISEGKLLMDPEKIRPPLPEYPIMGDRKFALLATCRSPPVFCNLSGRLFPDLIESVINRDIFWSEVNALSLGYAMQPLYDVFGLQTFHDYMLDCALHSTDVTQWRSHEPEAV
ncbi:hypothetical protein PR048_010454 [Dryococelus australis]|uniref:Uncharacterized protein n=1 Tax=Dryococelus australis TaxID=614101 RepID=A0ABQ9I2T4_9NEOP|nr:hypothetical protein PR048_010454 [Dryococelus australis]